MDVVTLVATARGTTEWEVVEMYTARQIEHIAKVYMKDKMLVLETVAGSFKSAQKSGRSGSLERLMRQQPLRPGMERKIHVIDIDKEPADSLRAKVDALMRGKAL